MIGAGRIMGTRANNLAVWLSDNSEDSDFDLPSPTLVSRSGVSTPDLFTSLLIPSDHPRYRDPSFSLEYSDLYDVQATSPIHPKQHRESPKFSGSSVFDSRIIVPGVGISQGKKQEGSLLERRRHVCAETPNRRRVKRILPSIGVAKREKLPVSLNRKNEVAMSKAVTPVKKIPKLELMLQTGETDNVAVSERHWIKTPVRRSELSKLLGYSPKPQSSRPHLKPVTPRPPNAPRGPKSPLTARYTGKALKASPLL